ncbi:hypothetical protein VWO06_09615, partial [Campylobacter coli]
TAKINGGQLGAQLDLRGRNYSKSEGKYSDGIIQGYMDSLNTFVKTNEQDHYMCEFFEMMVITQLLAMEISIRLGNDVDMPRNLA